MIVDQLYERFLRILDFCNQQTDEKPSGEHQKQLKKLTDDFNYVYKRVNVEEQGAYHYMVARRMKGNS